MGVFSTIMGSDLFVQSSCQLRRLSFFFDIEIDCIILFLLYYSRSEDNLIKDSNQPIKKYTLS